MWAGLPTKGLTMRQLVDLAYVAVLEDPITRREALDEQLAMHPDRDAWGTDPVAERGARAMMDLAGPPAKIIKRKDKGTDRP